MMYLRFLCNEISVLGAVITLREQHHSSIYTPLQFLLQEDSGKHISSIWLSEGTVGMSVMCCKMVKLDVSIARRILCTGGKTAETEVIHLSILCKGQLFPNELLMGCFSEFHSAFSKGYRK